MGRIRSSTSFLRVTLITADPQQTKMFALRDRKEKEERKDTPCMMHCLQKGHKLTPSLENKHAFYPKQRVYPRHKSIFINGELSYSNYTECLLKINFSSCNIKSP